MVITVSEMIFMETDFRIFLKSYQDILIGSKTIVESNCRHLINIE